MKERPARLRHYLDLHDLVLHRRIAIGGRGSSRSSTVGIFAIGIASHEVIGHLRVQLLCSLLSRSGAARLALLLVGALASRGSFGVSTSVLVSSGGLGLSLGLSDALTQGLWGGEQVGVGDNNLNLHGSVVDEQTVQLLEGEASAVRMVEDDAGSTLANATRAV